MPLADRLRAELAAFREVTGAEAEDVPDDACALSYFVPLVVGLELADRQHLLESPDTESRLQPPEPPFDLN